MAEVKTKTLSEELRSWGIGLTVMGILHFVLPFLALEWGMVLIPMGILALVIRHRGMFIAIGLSLILVGFLNAASGLSSSASHWAIFGCLQIYWGISEIRKYGMYGRLANETQLPAQEEDLNIGESRQP